MPHVLPGLLAGYLVVGLYVMGDFGAIALMRYEAFSFAIYNQYAGAFDRVYAAWLSIMLLVLALSFVVMEIFVLRRRRLASVGSGSIRPARPIVLRKSLPLDLFVFGLRGTAGGVTGSSSGLSPVLPRGALSIAAGHLG